MYCPRIAGKLRAFGDEVAPVCVIADRRVRNAAEDSDRPPPYDLTCKRAGVW